MSSRRSSMSRYELDAAVAQIVALWAELDERPRPGLVQRERAVKQALKILQNLADEFDSQRTKGRGRPVNFASADP